MYGQAGSGGVTGSQADGSAASGNAPAPQPWPLDIGTAMMMAAQIKLMQAQAKKTRSFQYIDDLVEAMIRVMNDTDDSFIGPVNLGNPNEFTIRELAEKVSALTGSSSKFVMRDLPSDDPKQRQPDITLAKSLIGWQPEVQLEEGLKKTIDYFRSIVKRDGD